MTDLQEERCWASGARGDEERLKLRRVRARLIKGLVQLVGVEPVPTGVGPRAAQPLTDDDRRRMLNDTLVDTGRALDDLSASIGLAPPALRVDAADIGRLRDMIGAARGRVEALLPEVDEDHPACPDRLKDIPKEAMAPLAALIDAWFPVRKGFVAVHGIGDQFQNETVQLVAYNICRYVGQPAAMPLGRFQGPGGTITRGYVPDPDHDPAVPCAFAEIYWADVPRGPAENKHVLEEPKKWARALVERLRLKARDKPASPAARKKARTDDDRLEQLIEELIQGIVVADRLVFLADKAGLFKFDLKKLLNDYLNDVQVVTEFEDYRRQMLEIFDDVLTKVHRCFPGAELYIVAHSEGTVVSFMGLLKGLSQARPWTDSVRGYMTIGSPLNKHVRFWPELFNPYTPPGSASEPGSEPDPKPGSDLGSETGPKPGASPKIQWKNYYDYGDPIGYNLFPTRDWMKGRGWSRFFDFQDPEDARREREARGKPGPAPPAGKSGPKPSDDIGFTRYFFPGKAHNDYWMDEAVFGHFIRNVVDPAGVVLDPVKGPDGRARAFAPPRSILFARITSYLIPYLLSATLLVLACYLLYKPVRACLDPAGAAVEPPLLVLRNVLGLSGLIAGMSLLARIPRLSRGWGWIALAVVLAVPLSSSGYLWISDGGPGDKPDRIRMSIEKFLGADRAAGDRISQIDVVLVALGAGGLLLQWGLKGLRPILWTLLPVLAWILVLRYLAGAPDARGALPGWLPLRSLAVVSIACWIGVLAWLISYRFPESGTKPLVHTGGLLILLIVVAEFVYHPASLPGAPQVPIWPAFLGGAAFLYIWWLAIVTFDLTFVWHLYIRMSGAQKYIEKRLRD